MSSSSEYPRPIVELVESLSALPGIGQRTAERLAVAMLDWAPEQLQGLGLQIQQLRDRVRDCRTCGNLADSEICSICLDPQRDRTSICVVENARQIPVIEKCRRFHGVYHVLGGHVSPLDGVEFEDLNIESLYRRLGEEPIKEVILSTSPDVEGEATAAYLAEALHARFTLTVSRIAQGIPVGSDLTFADAATMAMAMDSRRSMD